MEAIILKYRIYRDTKLTGVLCDSVGSAIGDCIRQVTDVHKGNFTLQVKIHPKHINEYFFVIAFDEDQMRIMYFKIEVAKERMKFVDVQGDFDKDDA